MKSPYEAAHEYLTKHEQRVMEGMAPVFEALPTEARETVVRTALLVGLKLAVRDLSKELEVV